MRSRYRETDAGSRHCDSKRLDLGSFLSKGWLDPNVPVLEPNVEAALGIEPMENIRLQHVPNPIERETGFRNNAVDMNNGPFMSAGDKLLERRAEPSSSFVEFRRCESPGQFLALEPPRQRQHERCLAG